MIHSTSLSLGQRWSRQVKGKLFAKLNVFQLEMCVCVRNVKDY